MARHTLGSRAHWPLPQSPRASGVSHGLSQGPLHPQLRRVQGDMWSLGSRLEQEQDDMSDQMQRQQRGCGGHPALRAKCDTPVTLISKLKSFEKPKPCKRKQRTCLVRSRLRCRPRKARCRRGLGSSRKRRAPCWRQAGLGPPAPPAASRGSPGTFLTARSWGQRGHARPAGDPRGDRAGHPSLRTNLGNRRGSTGASGPGTGLRQADPRPREACRNASHACRTPRAAYSTRHATSRARP